ncbi:MAG: superoxide dismutase [Patescibacteria group bacterium]
MQPIFQLPYQNIPDFLSELQLSEHYKLYNNYYNQTNDLPAKINGSGTSNPAGIRGAQKTLQYALAGRDLHEYYFGGMSVSETSIEQIPSKLKTLIEQSFGSVESWQADFTACAMAARGWAIVELDERNGVLYNVVADFHDEGSTIGFKPVVVLDMYEHAYFADYQTNKKAYIENWWKHISWETVASRLS